MEEENKIFENRIDLTDLKNDMELVKAEIQKIIVGQHDMLDLLIIALLSNGHVLIEGVPGVGKTLAAKLMAQTLKTGFSRIQFTPDLMPSDVLGTTVFNFKTSEFDYKKGPIYSNIVLIDEINRAPAKTQAALFEVMEERQITMEGETFKMDSPFLVLATQNPVEQEGTYKLPEAQLDRFIFKILVGYPTLEEEVQIINTHHQRNNVIDVKSINAVLTPAKIKKYQKQVGEVRVEENLMKYIAQIVNATRENRDLYLGASPRASLAIMNGAKSIAAMTGRDFVTPEDIKYMAVPVMRHRIILTPEREMEGLGADQIITQMIDAIEVPR